jgi:hypothetical protein
LSGVALIAEPILNKMANTTPANTSADAVKDGFKNLFMDKNSRTVIDVFKYA